MQQKCAACGFTGVVSRQALAAGAAEASASRLPLRAAAFPRFFRNIKESEIFSLLDAARGIAEIDFDPRDPLAFEDEALGVAKTRAGFQLAFVNDESLVSALDDCFDVMGANIFGVRPAAGEIIGAPDIVVVRADEDEIVGNEPFDGRSVLAPIGFETATHEISKGRAHNPYPTPCRQEIFTGPTRPSHPQRGTLHNAAPRRCPQIRDKDSSLISFGAFRRRRAAR